MLDPNELIQEARALKALPDGGVSYTDPLHRRLADAYRAVEEGVASPLDLAVLLRQAAKRYSTAMGAPLEVSSAMAALVGAVAGRVGLQLTALPAGILVGVQDWNPEWIHRPVGAPALDDSASAGLPEAHRAVDESLPADPAFTAATGYTTYRTKGQRDVVRAALENGGGTLTMACLPTGSGKTEVAITVAERWNASINGRRCSVMVVPTVSLAYDLERRFQERWAALRGPAVAAEPFAWTGATSDADRAKLEERIGNGSQPIIVTSPESLTSVLADVVASAASAGRLGSIIVDEAHLVSQWGRGFRPQYRLLGELWNDVDERSPGGVQLLLLSATYAPGVADDLLTLFLGDEGWDTATIVGANALRPEPDFWVAEETSPEERCERVVESLLHLPRPLILYVTKPEQAVSLEARLRSEGFVRLTTVSGDTNDDDRRAALEGFRGTADGPTKFDVVVATSAFGLGVDAPETRVVVHACMPESPDRWYQEIGRAGRDGARSTALLLPASGDEGLAASLGVKFLNPDVAAERWDAMWGQRRPGSDCHYVCLAAAPPGRQDGSYNRKWNSQVLEGLAQLEIIEKRVARRSEWVEHDLHWEGPVTTPPVWVRVALLGEPPSSTVFETSWVSWTDKAEAAGFRELALMKEIAGQMGTPLVCQLLSDAYGSQTAELQAAFEGVADGLGVLKGCGRCQGCWRKSVEEQAGASLAPVVLTGAISTSAAALAVDELPFPTLAQLGRQVQRVAVVQGTGLDEGQAQALAGLGFRLGVNAGAVASAFPYADSVVDWKRLEELRPMDCVLVADAGVSLHSLLVQLERRNHPGFCVLVVYPEVQRDFLAWTWETIDDFISRAQGLDGKDTA